MIYPPYFCEELLTQREEQLAEYYDEGFIIFFNKGDK